MPSFPNPFTPGNFYAGTLAGLVALAANRADVPAEFIVGLTSVAFVAITWLAKVDRGAGKKKRKR